MSTSKMMFACVCIIGLSQLVWSQNNNISAVRENYAQGIPGYLDPRTGTFTARAQNSNEREAVTSSVFEYYGTYVIELTIGIHTTIPTSDVITCSAEADLYDTYGDYTDTAATIATRTGSTATCTMTINYYYLISNPTTDSVQVSWKVNALQTVAVGSVTEAASARETTRTVPGFAVPSIGATTTLTYGLRL